MSVMFFLSEVAPASRSDPALWAVWPVSKLLDLLVSVSMDLKLLLLAAITAMLLPPKEDAFLLHP